MWEMQNLPPASPEDADAAINLSQQIFIQELAIRRLPDFIKICELLGVLCIPFRDHDVDIHSEMIFWTIRRWNGQKAIILENPLYENSSTYVASLDLQDRQQVDLAISEQVFSGPFVLSVDQPKFLWIGNYSDFGFMFANINLLQDVFQGSAHATYMAHAQEFRLGCSGDTLLDSQIRKLDELWAEYGADRN